MPIAQSSELAQHSAEYRELTTEDLTFPAVPKVYGLAMTFTYPNGEG